MVVNIDALKVEPVLLLAPTPEDIAALESFKKRRRFGYTIITNSLVVKDNTAYLVDIIDELPRG